MNGEIRECPVAVVGGAGFLGSHLVNHLVEDRNCKVLAVDNLCTGLREWVHPRATFLHHDITGSETRLLHAFMDWNVQWVFNYAAEPYVPYSYVRPVHVSMVNAIGAMKVINAAQEAGCKGILQVSSAELYGEGQRGSDTAKFNGPGELALDEEDPVVPHSSYGVSKAFIDSWIQVRELEAKTPCIALRQFNCVGERETHPYVIPEIISQLSGGPPADEKTIREIGYGTAVVRLGNNSARDFMYAGDAVKIAVELLERGRYGEVYNLGSETSIRIYDLAKLIGELMGFKEVRIEETESRKRRWEIWHLQSDNTKIKDAVYDHAGDARFRNVLWSPTPVREALKRTIQWFYLNRCKWPWQK